MKRWMLPVLALALVTVGCQKDAESPADHAAVEGGVDHRVEEAEADEVAGEPMPSAAAPEMVKEMRAPSAKKMAMANVAGKIAPMPDEPAPPADGSAEEFKDHGVNPWTDTAIDALSTFSIDVDTGSYTIARKKLYEMYRIISDNLITISGALSDFLRVSAYKLFRVLNKK